MTHHDDDDTGRAGDDWWSRLQGGTPSVSWRLSRPTSAAPTLSGNPARDSSAEYALQDHEDVFEDDYDRELWTGHRESGQVLAAARGRLRQSLNHRKRTRGGEVIERSWTDSMKNSSSEEHGWWDPVTDQPLTTNVRWAGSNYQLPIVPRQKPKDPKQRQMILEQTIHSLRITNTSTPWREKYEALNSRFAVARVLQTQVVMRTEMFKDLASLGYSFSEVVVVDRNLQPVPGLAVAGINIDPRRRSMAKYISTTITSRPDQIPQAHTIADLPSPEMQMDVLIKLPILNDGLHPDFLTTDTLLNPNVALHLIKTIPQDQGGGTIHAGLRRHGQMMPEPFAEWMDNVVAQLDFAVMNTLLRRDYINTDTTSSPDTRLRMTTQRYPHPKTGTMVVSTVAEFYERILSEVRMLDYRNIYTVNIPKLFFDGLLPKIREGLLNKRVIVPDIILPNQVALEEMSRLKRQAEEVEKEHSLLTSLVHQALDRNNRSIATRSFTSGRAMISTPPTPLRVYNEYYCSDDETNLYDEFDQPQYSIIPQRSRHRVGYALVSIAEKALREASGSKVPPECWGCGGSHYFGACPHKNKKEVVDQFKKRLAEYLERKNDSSTKMLSASSITREWQSLGFHNQRQAEILIDVMKADTGKATRYTLLQQLITPKALISSIRPACDDTNENKHETTTTDKPATNKRILMFYAKHNTQETTADITVSSNNTSRTEGLLSDSVSNPTVPEIDDCATDQFSLALSDQHRAAIPSYCNNIDIIQNQTDIPEFCLKNGWVQHIHDPKPFPPKPYWHDWHQWDFYDPPIGWQHERDQYDLLSIEYKQAVSVWLTKRGLSHNEMDRDAKLLWQEEGMDIPFNQNTIYLAGICACKECRETRSHFIKQKRSPYSEFKSICYCSVCISSIVKVEDNDNDHQPVIGSAVGTSLDHNEDKDEGVIYKQHAENSEEVVNVKEEEQEDVSSYQRASQDNESYREEKYFSLVACGGHCSDQTYSSEDNDNDTYSTKNKHHRQEQFPPVRALKATKTSKETPSKSTVPNGNDELTCLFTIPRNKESRKNDETNSLNDQNQHDGRVLQAPKKSRLPDKSFRLTSNLPHIDIQIGNEDTIERETFYLRGCLDSCAGGTIGYRPYHEHIVELFPHLINRFVDYKTEGIKPLIIGGIEEHGDGIYITAEVNYKTPYFIDGVPVELIVGLSDEMSANTIFGLPLQNKAKFIINFEEQAVTSMTFRSNFQLFFQQPTRYEEVSDQYGNSNKVFSTHAAVPELADGDTAITTCTDIVPFVASIENVE
jgi:hypothetical protein